MVPPSLRSCPRSVRQKMCRPKKGVWNFRALKTPAFVETEEFQTPFFGPGLRFAEVLSACYSDLVLAVVPACQRTTDQGLPGMNPLQQRLAALRRRLRFVVTFRGVCWIIAIVCLALAAGGLLDWRVHLPDLVRALLLAGTLSGAGCIAYRYLLRPLWARSDDLSLALQVEACYPALNDALASAVQFLEQAEGLDSSSSPSLRKEAVQRALGLAKGFDFRPVVSARGIGAAGLSLAGAGTLALFLTLAYPQLAWTAFLRFANPFGGHDWPRQTQLEIKARTRTARNEAFEIHAIVRGVVPERAVVEYQFEGAAPLKEAYEITRRAEAGELQARLEPGRVQRSFRFQVRANDAASPWFEVEVLPPPQLTLLAGRPSPQIHLHYPEYTDLLPQDLPDGASSIEAIAGTEVTLQAAVDRPLARAWLEYPADREPALAVAGSLGALATPPLVCIVDLAVAQPPVWKRISAQLSPDGRVLSLAFIMRLSGTFALHFEDEMGIGNTRLVEVHTLLDPAPVVRLERPSRTQDSFDVSADAEITLGVQAVDPIFAIRSLYLEYRIRREGAPAAVGPSRLPLYDHAAVGEAIPQVLAALGGSPVPVAAPALRLRTQLLDVGRRWSLKGLKLREGDVLALQACADDFDDVTVLKEPGRSPEVELHIVGRNALDIGLYESQAQIEQEIVRLREQQREALEKVIPAEAQWRNKVPLQAKHLDDLLQAEQTQQQIRARVGTRQEGLRAQVARILQTMRDNHLPRSGAQDRLETILAELDRLSREELE